MTERRENIARADTRWAKAYEEWNAGPRELGTGRRMAFLAGWQAARQALLVDAAIAADDGAVGRVLALADGLDESARICRTAAEHEDKPGQRREMTDLAADFQGQADRIRAAVNAPATAEDETS